MYIDRIRINWDKVGADSYLTRIPAICLLQELAFRQPEGLLQVLLREHRNR